MPIKSDRCPTKGLFQCPLINNVDFSGSCYISEDFTEITVTSDKDFDENHPAGESLNDLCRFISFSPYKFISSGYRDYYVFSVNNVSLSFVNYAGKFIGNYYCPLKLFDSTKN